MVISSSNNYSKSNLDFVNVSSVSKIDVKDLHKTVKSKSINHLIEAVIHLLLETL